MSESKKAVVRIVPLDVVSGWNLGNPKRREIVRPPRGGKPGKYLAGRAERQGGGMLPLPPHTKSIFPLSL